MKAFVAGSTGETGKRVVSQLRAAGIAVRAGARDLKKAESLGFKAAGAEIVHADVTEGVDALVEAIGDADAVICATGFTPSFNFGKVRECSCTLAQPANAIAIAGQR